MLMSRLRCGRNRAVAAVTATLISSVVLSVPAAQAAQRTVEETYAARGPWAVSTLAVDTRYVIHHPTNLGAGNVRHPIVTWGNGTGGNPRNYPGLLNQLASWGFVVIASTSPNTGKGTEMLAGVDYLVARNTDPASVFAGRLDTAQVAAAGHSQGAGGAARAGLASNGRIRTVVTFNPPDPFWVAAADRFDFSQLRVPLLLMTGQHDWISLPQTLTTYYDQVVEPQPPVVRAALGGADHNTIQRTGGRYLGYVTAWLRYQLAGDQYAGTAFRGSPKPELLDNPAWLNQAAKNLP